MELDAEIKARIPAADRRALKKIAKGRQLKMADVVREALRDFMAKEKLNPHQAA